MSWEKQKRFYSGELPPHVRRRRFIYNLLLLSTMIIWAGSFIFIKIGLNEIGPFNLAFYRFLLASPLLTAYVYARGNFSFPAKSDLIAVTILALTGVSLLYAIQFLALLFTTATNASILINTSVLFVAIFAFITGEKLTLPRGVGILLSFIGIILVVSKGSFEFFTSKTLYGDLLMILDGLLWAVYTILGKKTLTKYGSENLTANVFLIGVLLLFPFALWEGIQFPVSTHTIFAILYLSVLCSVFAYLVWYYALAVSYGINSCCRLCVLSTTFHSNYSILHTWRGDRDFHCNWWFSYNSRYNPRRIWERS